MSSNMNSLSLRFLMFVVIVLECHFVTHSANSSPLKLKDTREVRNEINEDNIPESREMPDLNPYDNDDNNPTEMTLTEAHLTNSTDPPTNATEVDASTSASTATTSSSAATESTVKDIGVTEPTQPTPDDMPSTLETTTLKIESSKPVSGWLVFLAVFLTIVLILFIVLITILFNMKNKENNAKTSKPSGSASSPSSGNSSPKNSPKNTGFKRVGSSLESVKSVRSDL